MKNLIVFLFILSTLVSSAQSEFHVFPVDGKNQQGSSTGDGSLKNPWDLQTALSQSSERVNGGDIIWLHQGIYNGRFKSNLNSTNPEFITVSAYKNDRVVLNGNVKSNSNIVLDISGNHIVFKNFEVTFLGAYSRDAHDDDFKACTGINHRSGVSKFQNLKIYNNPGLGFGSWKNTGGSVIEDCMIFFNGMIGKVRGSGEGMYVQNNSDDTRIIRNNIIFGNYYKGVEIWSASSGRNESFIQNIDLTDNIIFNNGTPSGRHWGNVIVATNDKDAVNIAKHIKVKRNILYHNVDFITNKKLGNASSLALGFIKKAPVEDVEVTDNVIIGQNNGLGILHGKSLVFKNNVVYAGYVHLEKTIQPQLGTQRIVMDNNRYYTKKHKAFRISKFKDYSLSDWQSTYGIDANSSWNKLSEFTADKVLTINQLSTNDKVFNIALLEKEGNDVTVDFSDYNIKKGMTYKIYDIENRKVVVKSGKVDKNLKINFPMSLSAFEMPLNNTIAKKSADNFGVYRIVFKEKKKGFFGRFFGWLF
jgi:hypothetical protein